jgi:ElaB/YqjD/DUF883 family membrane-anchored ribosome-binding protein
MMVEPQSGNASPAAAPDKIGAPGIGGEDAAGKDATSRASQLWRLRQDIAKLREDVAAIAQSRAVKAAGLVRRKPWSAMAAALCVGICLGRRSLR